MIITLPPSREDITTEDTLFLREVGGGIKKDIIRKKLYTTDER